MLCVYVYRQKQGALTKVSEYWK